MSRLAVALFVISLASVALARTPLSADDVKKQIIDNIVKESGKQIVPECNYNPSKVIYALYIGSNTYPINFTGDGHILPRAAPYDSTERQTKFLIHDWMSDPSFANSILSKYQKLGNLNVVMVDWSAFANCRLSNAKENIVAAVGNTTGYVIDKLKDSIRWRPTTIHMIGHGIGARMAGFCARYLQLVMKDKVERITALDPNALHAPVENKDELNPADAKFIDVIYTRIVLQTAKIGHFEVFPYDGLVQPGCKSDDYHCSHYRSVELYDETIDQPKKLCAGKAKSYSHYLICTSYIPDEDLAFIGEPASSSYTGTYYLVTNSTSPFGLGCRNKDFICKN